MKISEIKELLATDPEQQVLEQLAQDTRAGVQRLLAVHSRAKAKAAAEKERYEAMLTYEREYYAKGVAYIAGVDEAGRGPLAGPLVVAAVILPQGAFLPGLNDSKQLTAAKREALYEQIMAKALAIQVAVVGVATIDSLNIYQATKEAMAKVVEGLKLRPTVALIDAMPLEIEGVEIKSLIHGDALSASIAAASIIAKVTRDRIMDELDSSYPEYGFKNNKGYGSKAHMEAIKAFGPTKYHRRSYEPLKSMALGPAPREEDRLYSPLEAN